MDARILVVDDEKLIVKGIRYSLEQEGMEVDCAYDGIEAVNMARKKEYDVILLDVMLPGLTGYEVCQKLREKSDVPIIMLTAKSEDIDKIMGLEYGADDYITKPFAIEELLARIRVALKQHNRQITVDNTQTLATGKVEEGVYVWNGLKLEEKKRRVTYNNQEITLTNREFLMLETLLQNMDIVLSRDTLLEKVCGYDYVGETNVVDVYVRFLRAKIDDVFGIKMIQTVRGVGYVIKSE